MQLGRTPLHWAGRNRHVEVYHFLYGVTDDVDLRDKYGITARYFLDSCRLGVNVEGGVVHSEGEFSPSASPPPPGSQLQHLHSPYDSHTDPSRCPHLEPPSQSLCEENALHFLQECASPLSPLSPLSPASDAYESTLDEPMMDCSSGAGDGEDLFVEGESGPSCGSRTSSRTLSIALSAIHRESWEMNSFACGNDDDVVPVQRDSPMVSTLQQRALHIRRLTLLLFSSKDMLYGGESGGGGEVGEPAGSNEEGHLSETLCPSLSSAGAQPMASIAYNHSRDIGHETDGTDSSGESCLQYVREDDDGDVYSSVSESSEYCHI